MSFSSQGMECKSRKSRNTLVTGKFGLGVQNEAGQRLIEFCQENTLVIANTLFQQHKRWLYTWTSPEGQHWNQTDYILCSWRRRSSVEPAKIRLGADYGSDREVLIAKSVSSVSQSCLNLCDPMDCSMPGFPVHHQLLELTQTHVHWVGDATQPSHPLSSPSPPTFDLSQHQGLF